MTKLMIDGKALYIHRANYQIIDAFSGLQEYHDEKTILLKNTDVDYTIKQTSDFLYAKAKYSKNVSVI